MRAIRCFAGVFAAMVLCVTLAACGGGGGGTVGGGSSSDGGLLGGTNTDRETVMLAVAAYDANAAFDRLLNSVGTATLTGSGTLTVKSCAGGGSVQAEKSAGRYVLAAANCKLSAGEPLVYNGTWTFNLDGPGFYSPDGNCASGSCSVGATVAGFFDAQGKFGYGTAVDDTYSMRVTVATSQGVQTIESSVFTGATIVDSIGLVFSTAFTRTIPGGVSSRVSVYLGNGTPILALTSADDRQSLMMTLPFNANISVNTVGVSATIDRDKNGQPESTISIPWSEFQ